MPRFKEPPAIHIQPRVSPESNPETPLPSPPQRVQAGSQLEGGDHDVVLGNLPAVVGARVALAAVGPLQNGQLGVGGLADLVLPAAAAAQCSAGWSSAVQYGTAQYDAERYGPVHPDRQPTHQVALVACRRNAGGVGSTECGIQRKNDHTAPPGPALPRPLIAGAHPLTTAPPGWAASGSGSRHVACC